MTWLGRRFRNLRARIEVYLQARRERSQSRHYDGHALFPSLGVSPNIPEKDAWSRFPEKSYLDLTWHNWDDFDDWLDFWDESLVDSITAVVNPTHLLVVAGVIRDPLAVSDAELMKLASGSWGLNDGVLVSTPREYRFDSIYKLYSCNSREIPDLLLLPPSFYPSFARWNAGENDDPRAVEVGYVGCHMLYLEESDQIHSTNDLVTILETTENEAFVLGNRLIMHFGVWLEEHGGNFTLYDLSLSDKLFSHLATHFGPRENVHWKFGPISNDVGWFE